MSLFEDFLERKCTVLCRTEEEQKAFQTYVAERGIRWCGGEDPRDEFPQSPPLFYYTPKGMAHSGMLTYSEFNTHTNLLVVNCSDLAEEISPKEIPSPLALLTSRR